MYSHVGLLSMFDFIVSIRAQSRSSQLSPLEFLDTRQLQLALNRVSSGGRHYSDRAYDFRDLANCRLLEQFTGLQSFTDRSSRIQS
jgi:hypothetical protein